MSPNSIDGFGRPPEARSDRKILYGEHQINDKRSLNGIIAESLRARGLNATSRSPVQADFTVTYLDRLYWNLRTYMVDLKIDVHDARTSIFVATGRSFQTSLAAMRRTTSTSSPRQRLRGRDEETKFALSSAASAPFTSKYIE